MPDEIVEFKPGVGPFKLNVVALLKKLALKSKYDPVAVVARRFLQLFQDHDVPITQIPRLIPQITLDKLSTTETLLPALTGEVLELAASLFWVRRGWLEGVEDEIYDTRWCYKSPERFFSELANIEIRDFTSPIAAFCSMKKLDGSSDREQPIALVFREKLCDLGDKEIHRYRVFCDEWDWGYWKCRIQLKAMARMVDKMLHDRIPLHQVKPSILKSIQSGCCVPHHSLRGTYVNHMSLEDFGLSPMESPESKEPEELPRVMEYIKHYDLENVARKLLAREC